MSRPAAWWLIITLFVALGIGIWLNAVHINDLNDRLRGETSRALLEACQDRQRNHDAADALASQVYAPFDATSVSGQTTLALLRSLGLTDQQINVTIQVGNSDRASQLAIFEQKIGDRPDCVKNQLTSNLRTPHGN